MIRRGISVILSHTVTSTRELTVCSSPVSCVWSARERGVWRLDSTPLEYQRKGLLS